MDRVIKIGWNKVVGTKKADIVNAVLSKLSEDSTKKKWMNFYGDGRASEKIVEVLKNYGG